MKRRIPLYLLAGFLLFSFAAAPHAAESVPAAQDDQATSQQAADQRSPNQEATAQSESQRAQPERKSQDPDRKALDRQQRESYLRAVPPGGMPIGLEGDVIKMHSLREWHHLTYPTGTLPSQPWNAARDWVEHNVVDSPPWSGKPVRIGGRSDVRDGASLAERALVTPNVNTWTAVGPLPLDSVGTTNNAFTYGIVAGRAGAEALASDPSDPTVAWAGFVAGGVWKTTNLGSANVVWTPLWEDKDFVTQSVTAIELDPNDSDTVYVGTGDWPAVDQFSAGIMKSTDGGANWTQLGADIFTPYSPTLPATGNRWSNQNIKTIQVDPNDSSTVLVGTRYDLYISHDAGSSWEICPFGNGYTDPSVTGGAINSLNRVSDIYLDARGASTVAYVAVGYQFSNGNGSNGVYRFTVPSSGCPAWPGDFTTLFGGFPAGTGNGVIGDSGGAITGRIELGGAIGGDSQLTLYAQVSEGFNYTAEGTYVLRPDGGSTTWTKLAGSTAGSYTECDGSSSSTGQDWYDLLLAVDPADDKTLYIGHIDVFKATVNGSYSSMTLTNLSNVYSTGCPEYGTVHPDQHAFTFVEGSGGSTFLLGNDGGLYYNDNGGALSAWQQVNDTINTTQFYAGQIGADFAGNGMNGVQWLFGGMQDNGSASWSSSTADATWTARSVGGDGFYTSFDVIAGDENSGQWLTEYVYGDIYCSDTGAQGPFDGGSGGPFSSCGPSYQGSPDWSAPFMVDTLHCSNSECTNYVVGGDYVYVAGSVKRGKPEWTRISNQLSRTTIGSLLTVNVAPSEPKAIAVGSDDGKVWWTEDGFSGTGCTLAAANSSSFDCSPNSGATWVDVDPTNAVLPNRVVSQVAFDPADHNLFYAAVGGFDINTPTTPGHLFAIQDSGSGFTVVDKSGNLPDVPAASVAVNPHDPSQVFVGTYFGFYYSEDIDASPVNWIRYNEGLPNTVIKHLTIDRGPSSDPLLGTTLAAFTYGRGVFVLALPQPGQCTPPDAPTGLAAAVTVDNQIDLSWTGVAGATEYRIYRSTTSGGPYTQIDTTTGTTYDDTGVGAGTTYYYVVRAFLDCESGDSNEASATATGNQAPTADFSYSCTDLDCDFTDLSTDSDGTVVAWSWNFGDTNTSPAQNPSHTYASAGTYTVMLTVTDDDTAQDSTDQEVTVTVAGAINLSTVGYKVQGRNTVDLTWSGATSTNVDVYRDSVLITTTANDGAYTDNTGQRGGATYVYQVCEEGTSNCSNTSTVNF